MNNDIKHLSTGSKAPPLEKDKLRLYSMRFCPFAQRTHLVLNSKKIPHDVVYINLSQKPEWFLEKGSLGRVPCIEFENGDILYESLIITDYLDEAYPGKSLYPEDPLDKAKNKLLIEKFNAIADAVYKLYFRKGIDKELFNEVLRSLDNFEKELAKRGTSFFEGSQPGMLDLMIWPSFVKADILKFVRGDNFAIPEDRYLKLMSEWKVAMEEHPDVKVSLPDLESHTKYMKSYVAGATQYDFED